MSKCGCTDSDKAKLFQEMMNEPKFKKGETVLVKSVTMSGIRRAPWVGVVDGEIRTGVHCLGSVEYLVRVKAPEGPGRWVFEQHMSLVQS